MNSDELDPGLVAALAAVKNNRSELARRLGISPQAVNQWSRVPIERVLEVEEVTGVPREVLRPDRYPPPRPKSKLGTNRIRKP